MIRSSSRPAAPWILRLLLACVLMLALASAPVVAQGISPAATPSAPAPAPEPAPRIVRYAVLAAFPPFQVWPEGGVPGGADLEIVGELARAAGIVLQPVRYTDVARLEADLEAGRVQLASAMARTREREDRLLYTPPYGQFQLALVTRAEQPSGALLPDLAGRSIAVVSGYASQLQADRLFPLASRVVVKTPREGLQAVSSGRADTVLESLPVLTEIIEREQLRGLAIVRRIDAPSGRLHLAVPLGETALAARLAAALQRYPVQRVESLVEAWTARAPSSRPQGLAISAEEAARLAAWPAPVIGVVGREPPFAQINDQGAAEGLSVDMLRSVLARLGVQPRAWVFLKDEDVNAALLEGRVDILIGADESAARAALLRFVGPFIEYPSVLIGRPEGGAFDLTQLYGRRLALPPASSARPFVESRHPGVQIVDCAAIEACLQAVRDGAADATLADVISAAVVMARQPGVDVQIVGVEAQLRRFHSLALAEQHAAVVPLFKRALDVAIEQEMPALKARWFSRPLQAEVLRGAAWRYGPWAAAALLLLAALWWWHSRSLHAEVRRRLVAQQAAERVGVEKARFATFLAHEVRNSLHAVIAGGELARQLPSAGPAAHALPDAGATARMAEAARSTLRLLNNLIDRDRLDAGRLRLHAEPARLGPLVQAVVDEMAPTADVAGLGLHVQLAAADPMRQLDPLRLQQVLRNVLANALKYSQQGTVEVAVMATEPAAPDDVVIEVRDRGRGVIAAEVPGLFEPYAATHRNADSAGLGLPISRELARLMGGELTLAPREGGGAVARFTLRAEALPEAPALAGAAAARRLSVLVVEDAEVFGLLLAHAFEQRGHAVQVVGTLAQARQRLAEGGVDLLLSDLHLPDGAGAELLAWARQALPAPQPRLVAMTADLDTDAAGLEGEGVLAVLEKTGDAAGLVDRVLREAAGARGDSARHETEHRGRA